MSQANLATLLLELKSMGLQAWLRPLGEQDAIMVGSHPKDAGGSKIWQRAAHIWAMKDGSFCVNVATMEAGYFQNSIAVATYIQSVMAFSSEAYDCEIMRLSKEQGRLPRGA